MAFPLTSVQTLTTAASPAALWRAFERVDLWPTALPALLTARLEPPGPLAAGQSVVTRATPESKAGDLSYRVIAAEAPHRLTLAIDDTAYRATTDYQIVTDRGATDVVVTSTLEAVGVMQTLRFVLWRQRLTPMLAATARERTLAFIALAERLGESA